MGRKPYSPPTLRVLSSPPPAPARTHREFRIDVDGAPVLLVCFEPDSFASDGTFRIVVDHTLIVGRGWDEEGARCTAFALAGSLASKFRARLVVEGASR